ncbi:MAG: NUDIX hydrolase [Thermoplasmata archaeon]|nr:NUDIX hydrolase [Candidatus Sysuiplasma jiujiangense]
MNNPRKFADFYEGAQPFQMDRIPEGGMCLSVFLVLWKGDERSVLMGRLNPEFDWVRIGALSPEYAGKLARKWMLPSSHLLLYESPEDAAGRVLKEQLGLSWDDLNSHSLSVFSEVYGRNRHWDIEFVLKGEVSRQPSNAAWTELKFLDVRGIPVADFARSHQDILAEAGLR